MPVMAVHGRCGPDTLLIGVGAVDCAPQLPEFIDAPVVRAEAPVLPTQSLEEVPIHTLENSPIVATERQLLVDVVPDDAMQISLQPATSIGLEARLGRLEHWLWTAPRLQPAWVPIDSVPGALR